MAKTELTVKADAGAAGGSTLKGMEQVLRARRESKASGTPLADHPLVTVRTAAVAAPAPMDADEVRAVRAALGVSQAVFAEMIGVSTVLVGSWEQGQRSPNAMARRMLRWIASDPAAFVRQAAA